MSNPNPSRLPSKFWRDDQKVLNGAVRDRVASRALPDPRFSDGVWDLNALVDRVNLHASEVRINFDRAFENPVRHLVARELVMQRLNRPLHAVGAKPTRIPGPTTIVNAIRSLKLFFDFMDTQMVQDLADVDQPLLNRYILNLRDRKDISAHHAASRLAVIFWLYEARTVLSGGGIRFVPWPELSASQLFKVATSTENKTPRIPEPVMQPLLKWAIDYVYLFSDQIITNYYLHQVTALHCVRKVEKIGGLRAIKERTKRLQFALTQIPDAPMGRFVEKEFLPKDSPLRLYGAPIPSAAFFGLVREAEKLGLNVDDISTAPAVLPSTGRPWRSPIDTPKDLMDECRNLIAACYIVCAYLSGMRDSEIQAMKAGCLRYLRDKDGNIVRRYVSSIQYKHRSNPAHERAWVVTEHVAKAVEVMTRIGYAERQTTSTKELFIFLQKTQSQSSPHLKNRVNVYLNEFIEHVNDVLVPWADHEEARPIPIAEFQPLTTRMFRRTVAWYIANRPYGTVAGMIQYGHLSTQMFEGYAGSSESGFRQEVEAERALARMADIIEMYEDFKLGKRPAGPMAPTLNGEFELTRDTCNDFPGKVIIDLDRRNKMLENWSRQLYPGLLADCFFDPNKAHCLSHVDKAEREAPVSGICNPHCKNACWRNRHLGVWQAALDDVEKLSKKNRLSPLQREILSDRKREYKGVIAQIQEASNGFAS